MSDPDISTNNASSFPPEFSHPSEAEFASLLDYFGIPWRYEPHTFVLEEGNEGNPVVAFSPGFYLPEQELYVKVPRCVKS